MLIKVEPTDFFMYRVSLIYDLEKPDSEDQDVRDYLIENELEPKYQGTGDYEGRKSEMMSFGGCYLGKHLSRIGEIQKVAVEVELLTAEIERHLEAASNDSPPLPKERRPETVVQLVKQFHQESSFQTNENGELIAVLNGDEVVVAAQRVSADSQDS